jgi:hypothetical protein
MTPPRRSLLSLAPLLALMGCAVPPASPTAEADAAASRPGLVWSVLEGEPAFAWTAEARGLIEAPAEVVAFVGHDLTFDVYATDPTLGRIAATSLPGDAVFDDEGPGGSLHWSPKMEDVGQYALVFLLLDAVEPDLVLAQTTVSVRVLPVNKLIEYGF